MKTFAEKQAELLQECREYIERTCHKYGERVENIDTAAFDAWKYIGWHIWLNGLYLDNERIVSITYREYLNGERELVVRVGNGLHNLECLPDEVALEIADQIKERFGLFGEAQYKTEIRVRAQLIEMSVERISAIQDKDEQKKYLSYIADEAKYIEKLIDDNN